MRKKYFLMFSAMASMAYAQVGIRSQAETLPSNYTFPHPSAALDVYSTNKGLLLPRVNLAASGLSNLTTPIASPTAGLLVYNNTERAAVGNAPAIPKGLYYFDIDPVTNTAKYNKVYSFNETPKASTILIKNKIKVLEGKNPGEKSFISEKNSYASTYSSIFQLDSGYSQDIRLEKIYGSSSNEIYGIVLQKGTYSIEINFFFDIPSSYIGTRSSPIRTANNTLGTINNDYYDVGYFFDITHAPFRQSSASNPITSFSNIRSETHSLTRPNQAHTASSINVITLDQETFLKFDVGRMQGSSYYDAADLLTNSYIEIKKISY